MRKSVLIGLLVLLLLCLGSAQTVGAQEPDDAVVRAIFFFSPACPHCQEVKASLLTPLLDQYGERLKILAADTWEPEGLALYQAAMETYQVPAERHGVPTLIVDNVVLIGSIEIPEQLPTLVKEGLAADGIPWAGIPGLEAALALAQTEAATATPLPTATECAPSDNAGVCGPEDTPGTSSLFAPTPAAPESSAFQILTADALKDPPLVSTDPVGFALALAVLLGAAAALVYSGQRLVRHGGRQTLARLLAHRGRGLRVGSWAIPVLVIVGLAIAAYLSHVELNQVEAICGPVGECNVVQTSEYARLLQVPIAVWGLVYYVAAGALWAASRTLRNRWASLALLALLGLALWSTVFSIYLTALELFAIRAVCSWCLGSAVVTTLLLLVVTRDVIIAGRAAVRAPTARARS